MSKSPSAIIKIRIFTACAIAILGFLFLIGRLFYIQIIESEEYQRQAAETQLKLTEIAANRGSIYDANGNKLQSGELSPLPELQFNAAILPAGKNVLELRCNNEIKKLNIVTK